MPEATSRASAESAGAGKGLLTPGGSNDATGMAAISAVAVITVPAAVQLTPHTTAQVVLS